MVILVKPALLLIACSLMLLPTAHADSYDLIRGVVEEPVPGDCFSTTEDIKPVDRWDDEYQGMLDCALRHYTGIGLPARIDVDATPDPYLHDPAAPLACAVHDLHEIVTAGSRACSGLQAYVEADHGILACYFWYNGSFGCYSAPRL